jgi:type I restriction enzyme S subunit
MAGEWKISTLGEIADASPHAFVDGPFGSNLPASCYTDSGVPIIRGSNLSLGETRFRSDEFVYVSDETANSLQRSCCKPLDIVFTKKGTLGQTGIVPENGKHHRYLLSGNQMKLTVDRAKADPLFVFYFVSSPPSRTKIVQDSEVTGVPKTNLTYLRTFPIPLPPLAEQKAIATVLGALDDKIELNRRMNATLEAMARALFQSWFVDFDPVRAKLDGRPPAALDPATAALFPTTFGETAAGHIPHGWRVGSIYEIANVIYGAPFASSLFNSEKLGKPLIRIRDLPNESPAVFTTEAHPTGYLLQPGDIAVGMDGEFRAYLWAGVESWLNQRCCVFAPKPGYSAAFVRNSIIAPLAQVEATETATTVIHLGKNDIDRFTVIIPDAPVAEAFKRQCQPWYDQIVANKQQSRTLATLRDTLLPKLLSGELSVAVLESKLEASR